MHSNQILHGEQDQRVRPEHDCNKCSTSVQQVFVHKSRYWRPSNETLCKTVLQGTLVEGRRQGRQRKSYLDNLKEWASLPIDEYSQQNTTDLIGGRFLYRRTSLCPNGRNGQGIDDDGYDAINVSFTKCLHFSFRNESSICITIS
ncbi:hypothetical protein DPMN_022936 [Dreissena polymorpha]|uniref:Uncharacterized protein n=1 Tax=Dreissena polymorpha TaxID=45954 RepID=A0A9D4LLX5_DREPO|nr:hypothetical protein DPMN_022936 [Dreissena polymorpha]